MAISIQKYRLNPSLHSPIIGKVTSNVDRFLSSDQMPYIWDAVMSFRIRMWQRIGGTKSSCFALGPKYLEGSMAQLSCIWTLVLLNLENHFLIVRVWLSRRCYGPHLFCFSVRYLLVWDRCSFRVRPCRSLWITRRTLRDIVLVTNPTLVLSR